jgi:hypothetical protein
MVEFLTRRPSHSPLRKKGGAGAISAALRSGPALRDGGDDGPWRGVFRKKGGSTTEDSNPSAFGRREASLKAGLRTGARTPRTGSVAWIRSTGRVSTASGSPGVTTSIFAAVSRPTPSWPEVFSTSAGPGVPSRPSMPDRASFSGSTTPMCRGDPDLVFVERNAAVGAQGQGHQHPAGHHQELPGEPPHPPAPTPPPGHEPPSTMPLRKPDPRRGWR